MYVKLNGYDNSINNWIDKKDDINVKVDLSNYATRADIKNISHVDTSSLISKTNLATLIKEVDKLDIDKLMPVPVDLSKLSYVVKIILLKRMYMIN